MKLAIGELPPGFSHDTKHESARLTDDNMADPVADDKPSAATAGAPPTVEQGPIGAQPSPPSPQDAMDVDVNTESNTDANEPTAATATGSNLDGATLQHPDPDAQAERDSNTEAETSTKPNGGAEPGLAPGLESEKKAEADAEQDADADADADGEPAEDRQTPSRLDNDMLTVIENVANYLTTYKESECVIDSTGSISKPCAITIWC